MQKFPQDPPPLDGFLSALVGMIRLRCPRCRQGRMFRGPVTMNESCPVCGLIFQREEGYFLGAMYVSYGLSVVLIGAAYWAVTTILPDAGIVTIMLLILAAYLPFVPLVFRYSRMIWICFDRAICPSDSSAGTYEKMQIRHTPTKHD